MGDFEELDRVFALKGGLTHVHFEKRSRETKLFRPTRLQEERFRRGAEGGGPWSVIGTVSDRLEMSSAVNVAATASGAAAAKAPSGGVDQAMASAAAFRRWNEGSSSRTNSLRRRMRHDLAGTDEPDLGINGIQAAAKASGQDVGVFLAGDNPATSGNGDSARGDGVRNLDPKLAGLVKGGEGGSDVERVDSLRVGRRRSFPSLAAASTLAALEREAVNVSNREFVGDVAIFERSRVRRAVKSRRKLADWVKGAGVDDSDGDTNLSW